MGRGDKEGADGAAVNAMRIVLSSIAMDGVVVIGEGEKDKAPMLFNGERIGDGTPPKADIAVDPIDGTTPTALGRGGALAVIAVSEQGTMFDPGPCVYMEKLAVGPRAVGSIDIAMPIEDNLKAVAKAKGTSGARPDRGHSGSAPPWRAHRLGARDRGSHPPDHRRRCRRSHRHRLAGDGGRSPHRHRRDARRSHRRCRTQVDGGEIQGRLWPRDPAERQAAVDAGYDVDAVLTTDDLVGGDNCFFAATGITDGELLHGVRYDEFGAATQSLVTRSKSGTVRLIYAKHPLHKLAEYSAIEFG